MLGAVPAEELGLVHDSVGLLPGVGGVLGRNLESLAADAGGDRAAGGSRAYSGLTGSAGCCAETDLRPVPSFDPAG